MKNLFASAAPGFVGAKSAEDSDFVKGSKAIRAITRRGFLFHQSTGFVAGKRASRAYVKPKDKKAK